MEIHVEKHADEAKRVFLARAHPHPQPQAAAAATSTAGKTTARGRPTPGLRLRVNRWSITAVPTVLQLAFASHPHTTGHSGREYCNAHLALHLHPRLFVFYFTRPAVVFLF
jgi:hypothetical protein